jgi:hypothetical protein
MSEPLSGIERDIAPFFLIIGFMAYPLPILLIVLLGILLLETILIPETDHDKPSMV